MQFLVFLLLLQCLIHGRLRCQNGSRADCDEACQDESTTEIETTTDIPIETERYVAKNLKSIPYISMSVIRFRFSNPCSATQTFDKSLCTCTDGSTPTSTRIKPVCSDNSKPDCSGACPDGSDPTRTPLFFLL